MAEDKENSLTEESVWGRKTLNTHAKRMAFRADSVQTCGHGLVSLQCVHCKVLLCLPLVDLNCLHVELADQRN